MILSVNNWWGYSDPAVEECQETGILYHMLSGKRSGAGRHIRHAIKSTVAKWQIERRLLSGKRNPAGKGM